jgi:D-sedoheptulose 7-phosphate isomerase
VAGAGMTAAEGEKRARAALESAARVAAEMAEGELPALAARAGELVGESLGLGGRVLLCGNGGSAADAQHLAAELVGRLDAGDRRRPLAGIALTTDTSALTALANDYGYEEVFARQVAALGRPGDVLVCISTSGASANIIRAAEEARSHQVRVVALCGPAPSPLDDLAEVALHAPGDSPGHVQQSHITLGHLICALAASAATA